MDGGESGYPRWVTDFGEFREKENPQAATWGMHKTRSGIMRSDYNPTFDDNSLCSDYFEEESFESFLNSLFDGGEIDQIELERERRRSGLSTLHIRRKYTKKTRMDVKLELAREFVNRDDHNIRQGELRVYQGGSLIECKRKRTWTTLERPGSDRGVVCGFSLDARRRMLRFIAKLERTRKPLFVTLTYPDEAFNFRLEGRTLKETHLKLFYQRLEYKYPGVSFIWRMEYASRKSGKHVGELFPHFHLLVWGVEDVDIEEVREFVASAWWSLCGKLSEAHRRAGTRVERIRSINGVFWYAAKYLSKEVADQNLQVGRWWGVKGKQNLPEVYCHVLKFLEDEHLRKIIDWMAANAGLPEAEWSGLSIFCDASDFFFETLDKLLFD